MIIIETGYELIKQPLQNNLDSVAQCIIGNNTLKRIVNDELYHKFKTVLNNFKNTLDSLTKLIDAQKYKLVIHDFGVDINLYIHFEIRKSMEPQFKTDQPRHYLNMIEQDMKPYVGLYSNIIAIAQSKKGLVLGLNINEVYKMIVQHDYISPGVHDIDRARVFHTPLLFFGFSEHYWGFDPSTENKYSTDLLFSTAVAWYSFSGDHENDDDEYDDNDDEFDDDHDDEQDYDEYDWDQYYYNKPEAIEFRKMVHKYIRQEERFLTVNEFNLYPSRINIKLKKPVIINTNTDVYIRKLINDSWFIKPEKLKFVEYMDNLYQRAWRQVKLNQEK